MDDRYSKLSDDVLISMIRGGTRAAMAGLVSRYLPLIRHKAAGYCLPGMEPEDVVQEGLIGLLKAVSLYSPEKSSFATFASICIASSLATAAKTALSQKSLPLSNYAPLNEGEHTQIDNTLLSNPEQHLVSAEQANELLQKIDTMLSPFEQQALKLYLSGHSYNEISDVLSTTSKAVDNALQRVRRKLRTVD